MELRHALAVEPNKCGIDQENLPEVEDMVAFCEGLVVVDEQSDIIRLVHYTTQQYIDRVSLTWTESSHKDIALACLAYLSFDQFSAGSCGNDKEFEARLQSNVLFDYCARHWGNHVRHADDKDVDKAALRFLTRGLNIKSAIQAFMVATYHFSGYTTHIPSRMEALHFTAQFGLSRIMTWLLADDGIPDIADRFGRTPLSYASEYGHLSVVELLTSSKENNVDSKDRHARTPLSWAAGSGNLEVVKKLVSCPAVDLNCKDFLSLSPLSWAARNGCFEVGKYLITRSNTAPQTRMAKLHYPGLPTTDT